MHRSISTWLAAALLALALPATADNCKGAVYLTFDTGTMTQAELIARTLKEENVKATFFLANEPTYRDDYTLDPSWAGYWKALADEGNAFGDHTWSHLYARRDIEGGKMLAVTGKGEPVTFNHATYCEELRKVDDAFHRYTGRHLSGMWRAPGGRTTQQTIRWAASCGYPVYVGWSDAGWLGDELPSDKYPNQMLLDRALKDVRTGDILLMHLGIKSRKEPLAPILKPLIEGLKARGFCFATLDAARR